MILLVGLLTIMDQDDVLKSDFDIKASVLTTVARTDEELLTEAGFVKITPTKID